MSETQRQLDNDSELHAKMIEGLLYEWFTCEQNRGSTKIYVSVHDLMEALKGKEAECNAALRQALSRAPPLLVYAILEDHVRLWLIDLRNMVKKFMMGKSPMIMSRYQSAAKPFFEAILAKKNEWDLRAIVRDCFINLLVTSNNHRVKQVVCAIHIAANSQRIPPVGQRFARPAEPPERFASPPRGSPQPRQRSRSPSPTRGTPESKQHLADKAVIDLTEV